MSNNNVFEEYRQLMIQLGNTEWLAEEEKKYQEIIKVIRQASNSLHDASYLLRVMVEDMGRLSQSSPVNVKEAAEWLGENRVYAWRGVDEALKHWGPHSESFQQTLVECRDWQAHLAEYMLQARRGQLQKEKQKKQGISLSDTHLMSMNGLVGTADKIVFNPNGKMLATCSSETIQLWDVNLGHECARLEGHTDSVEDIVFSPDGRLLASCSWDKTVRLWDVATGKLTTVFEGHNDNIYVVVFSPDGTLLASGASDKTVRLWNIRMGKEHTLLDGNVNIGQGKEVVVFDSSGELLAFPTKDNGVRLWNLETRKQQAILERHDKLSAYSVQAIAFSSTKGLLACYYNNNWVRLLDYKTGREKSMFQLEGARKIADRVALSSDGAMIAIFDKEKTIRVWDMYTGKAKAVIQKYSDYVDALVFIPNNELLATAGREEVVVRVWDTRTGKEKTVLSGHEDSVDSMAMNPAGNILATTSGDGTIRLWAVENSDRKKGFFSRMFS